MITNLLYYMSLPTAVVNAVIWLFLPKSINFCGSYAPTHAKREIARCLSERQRETNMSENLNKRKTYNEAHQSNS